MRYLVRNAQMDDLPKIEEIYAMARKIMADNQNPAQWGNTHPPRTMLVEDIASQRLFVLEEHGAIHGVFYFYIGEDPTYRVIEQGNWHQDGTYGTIHRIAGDGSGGILRTAVDFALEHIRYLRMDTHADNKVMQTVLIKTGFQPCGIIYVADGSPRIAYDRI